MSNRATPESDARTYIPVFGASTVPAEFARRLERGRDEAREKLSARWQSLRDSQDEVLRLTFENRSLSQSIEGWENKWKCAVDMAARAELERDEALKCAKEYYVEFIRNASSDNKVSKPNPLNPFYKLK